jgi:hypothetical protein
MRNSTFHCCVFATVILSVFVIAPGRGLAKSANSYIRLTPGIKAAMIGDSHVEALGPYTAAILGVGKGNKTNKVFRYEKHRGSRADQWMKSKKWGAWVDKFDPQIVVIVLGTNEAMTNQSEDNLVSTFAALADRFGKKGRLIFWVTPPVLTKPKHLPTVWRAIGRVAGIEVVDMSKTTYSLKRGGKHLKSKAYELWAELIAKRIAI